MCKTKKFSVTKKLFKRITSFVLALTVLVLSSPDLFITGDALAPTNPHDETQTGFKDLIEFQEGKWKEIVGAIFGKTDYKKSGYSYLGKKANTLIPPSEEELPAVRQNNPYFNWATDLGVDPWDGSSDSSAITDSYYETIEYNGDSFEKGDGSGKITQADFSIKYMVFNVENAAQLKAAMQFAISNNTKINILADIDLNGAEQTWVSNIYNGGNKWFYIEGNGHTIYNMKCYNKKRKGSGSFVGSIESNTQRFIMKNLNFSNCMTLNPHDTTSQQGNSIVVGQIDNSRVYMENVNVYDSFVWSATQQNGALIGYTYTRDTSESRCPLIRNCSSQNCIIYGSNHTGGLTGCQDNFISSMVKYDVPFPDSPEAWLNQNGSSKPFPEMIENCYSVDCLLFSVGDTGDSGGFVSCGDCMIIRNCFTNNTVYGRTKTGAFTGRVLESNTNIMYDDSGKKRVKVCFENCYASGKVEGTERIGGFVGFEDNKSITTTDCVTVYKNCYTTAMVGMDYSGEFLGGFIGHENSKVVNNATTKVNGTPYNNSGSVYINCYAAGEVGNLLTDTTAKVKSGSAQDKYLGGFMGITGYMGQGADSTEISNISDSNSKGNGTYVNCYYDMQTTAMRERACGLADQYETETITTDSDGKEVEDTYGTSQIPGVTGVYTQHSEIKGVGGLADTVNMGDDSAWKNNTADDQYPMLKAFDDYAADNFGTYHDSIKRSADTLSSNKRSDKKSDVATPDTASANELTANSTDVDTDTSQTAAAHISITESKAADKRTAEALTVESIDSDTERDKSATADTATKKIISKASGDLIGDKLAEKVEIVRNYAKASVSTVLLNHWDQPMDMNDGAIGDENNWKLGLPQNRLQVEDYSDSEYKWEKDNDGKYWCIEYTNLSKGSYDFKIQEGNSWSYNFGTNKFDGDNCTLEVPEKCNVKIKFDYIPNVSEYGINTNFQIWAEFYDKDGKEICDKVILGKNENTDRYKTWTAVGTFSNWTVTDRSYNLNFSGDDVYSGTFNMSAGDHEIKIAYDNNWAESYGKSGSSSGDNNNMTFSLKEDCRVRVEFDESTHLTTLTSIPADALENVQTEWETVDFKGYSCIGPTAITGYEWFVPAALSQCEMTDDNGDGLYEKTFIIPRTTIAEDGTETNNFGRMYGYKVIKDGEDTGRRKYYYVKDSEESEIELKFLYDSYSGETTVTSNPAGLVDDESLPSKYLDCYGVLGDVNLTGYDWGKDVDGNELPAEDRKTDDKIVMKQDPQNPSKYSIEYKNVKKGKYAFKVAGNGLFTSGVDFGGGDGNNYTFETNKETDITIEFDENTGIITVGPNDAIVEDAKETYVICGNENLTGKNKVITAEGNAENTMTYDEEEKVYSKTYEGILSNQQKNYTFKVVKNGQSNKRSYEMFTIYSDDLAYDEHTKYNLKITYDPNTKETSYKLYAPDGKDVSDYIQPPYIDTYNVAGDIALTGYDWLNYEEGDTNLDNARSKGKMTKQADGKYIVTFNHVKVGKTNSNVAFKVVANGNWASGIDYGTSDGRNYILSLKSEKENECSVTIEFDPKTQNITVFTTPDCSSLIDENEFWWYVCGTSALVSSTDETNPKTVYDTVRDITSTFAFTSANGMTWSNDQERNDDNNFYTYLGGNDNDGKEHGFDLEYKVEGNDITGKFNSPVIKIDNQGNEYKCTAFMPGRQWVKVDVNGGNRFLRLIPTAYLEAGSDATVKVLQAESDGGKKYANNLVTYSGNGSDYIQFDGLNKDGDDVVFKNYNFALTAAYAITDRAGMGYYGNYSKQNVQKYDKNMIRENKLDQSKINSYYVMTSVFGESGSYDDTNEINALKVDELVNQSLIGSSYDDGTNYAKTIVKVFKKGENNSLAKVFMDSTEDSTSDYHSNYMKWTGQEPFDKDDIGTYVVRFYWALSDGRYLQDDKEVEVTPNTSNMEKKGEPKAIEKGDEKIDYTVTFTNNSAGDFTVCDVLPFNGDLRYDPSQQGYINCTNMMNDNGRLKLDSEIKVECEGPIGDTSIYFTNSRGVQELINQTDENNLPCNDLAKKIDLTDGSWSTASSPDITAFAITGTQADEGEAKITITYSVTVENASVGDYYVNNAFFAVNNKTAVDNRFDYEPIVGVSEPVTTAYISRALSGYVWYDLDFDGRYDANEPPIEGVKVGLYREGETTPVREMLTSSEGYYLFENNNLAAGNYRVIFSDMPEEFKNAELSKNFSPTLQSVTKNGSRNLARLSEDNNYYINVKMPTGEEIYEHNNEARSTLGGSIQQYCFSKEFQNLALKTSVPDKNCSLTIKKVGSSNEVLDGVKFTLEYRFTSEGSGEEEAQYKPVPYTLENGEYKFVDPTASDGSQGRLYTFAATDSKGEIKFTGLPSSAEYRLTEIETKQGYNILTAPIEITLPYFIADNQASNKYIKGNGNLFEAAVGGTYYYDITYTVTNSKIPNMPLTGIAKNIVPIIVASVLFAVVISMFVIFKVRKLKAAKAN